MPTSCRARSGGGAFASSGEARWPDSLRHWPAECSGILIPSQEFRRKYAWPDIKLEEFLIDCTALRKTHGRCRVGFCLRKLLHVAVVAHVDLLDGHILHTAAHRLVHLSRDAVEIQLSNCPQSQSILNESAPSAHLDAPRRRATPCTPAHAKADVDSIQLTEVVCVGDFRRPCARYGQSP